MSYKYRAKNAQAGSFNQKRNRGNSKKSKKSKGSEYIDPSRFIKSAQITEVEEYNPIHRFEDFKVSSLIQKNLQAKGIIRPTPIQDQAIPLGLNGCDVIGVANTGTGKTFAFALPVLNKIINDKNSKALIIAPTRELAQQIESELRIVAKNSGISGALLIGGSPIGKQIRDLNFNPQVIVGTPGRIIDHVRSKNLNLSDFNMVVLDEVDRMLDMGFINDVTSILDSLKNDRQSFFFSATMSKKVHDLIGQFSNDPKTVTVKSSSTSDNVNQNIVRYQTNDDKIDKLHQLLLNEPIKKVIVFDETKHSVDRLQKKLEQRGLVIEAIHGGKTQGQRERALRNFKSGNNVNILVATDVAARGIDVPDVSHVINYSVPKVYDDYIHRVGRAGRAGQTGHALTFVASNS